MADKYLLRLREEREAAQKTVDDILERAASEDRDADEGEVQIVENKAERIKQLDQQIQPLADLVLRNASAASLHEKVNRATNDEVREGELITRSESDRILREEYPTAGSYIVAMHAAKSDKDVARRLTRVMAHQLTSDNPGLLPTPVIGNLLGVLESRRPTINSVGVRQMPAKGKNFERPRLTGHSIADQQSGEKQPLVSQKITVDSVSVPKVTTGTVINISQQDLDWSQPSVLDLVLSELYAAIAVETNSVLVDAFVAAVTQTHASTLPTFVSDFYTAAGMIIAETGQPPTNLWVSPDVWGQIGGATDSTGRPLFSAGSPSNSVGSTTPSSLYGSVLGVPLVVDSAFPAQTAILGDRDFVEYYESSNGQLRAVEPELLGLQVSAYVYHAHLIANPLAFVKMTGLGSAPLPLASRSAASKSDDKK